MSHTLHYLTLCILKFLILLKYQKLNAENGKKQGQQNSAEGKIELDWLTKHKIIHRQVLQTIA